MSVVIKLSIGNDNTSLSYTQTFSLQSPTFLSRRSESCLTIDYMSVAEFVVRLVCLSDNKVDEHVLRRSSLSLGFALHRVKLVVPGRDVENQTCRFIFDIRTMKSGVLAAISTVTLTEDTCKYEEGMSFLYLPTTLCVKQGVALTGRNTTGPPRAAPW